MIDESSFNLTDNLSKDIRKNPHPNGPEGTSSCRDFVFLKFLYLMLVTLIGKYKKNDSEGYHYSVNDEFRKFWIEDRLHLQCPRPESTIYINIPS